MIPYSPLPYTWMPWVRARTASRRGLLCALRAASIPHTVRGYYGNQPVIDSALFCNSFVPSSPTVSSEPFYQYRNQSFFNRSIPAPLPYLVHHGGNDEYREDGEEGVRDALDDDLHHGREHPACEITVVTPTSVIDNWLQICDDNRPSHDSIERRGKGVRTDNEWGTSGKWGEKWGIDENKYWRTEWIIEFFYANLCEINLGELSTDSTEDYGVIRGEKAMLSSFITCLRPSGASWNGVYHLKRLRGTIRRFDKEDQMQSRVRNTG